MVFAEMDSPSYWWHERREESSFTGSRYVDRRSVSPYRSQRHIQRNRHFSRSKSPSDSWQRHDDIRRKGGQEMVEAKQYVAPSAVVDRRSRRYKQAALEAEKA